MTATLIEFYERHKERDIPALVSIFGAEYIMHLIKEYLFYLAETDYVDSDWSVYDFHERDLTLDVLKRNLFIQSCAAEELKVSARAMHYKIHKFKIDHFMWRSGHGTLDYHLSGNVAILTSNKQRSAAGE